jgi:hypothetical protein
MVLFATTANPTHQNASGGVLHGEALIGKGRAINGLTTVTMTPLNICKPKHISPQSTEMQESSFWQAENKDHPMTLLDEQRTTALDEATFNHSVEKGPSVVKPSASGRSPLLPSAKGQEVRNCIHAQQSSGFRGTVGGNQP